MHAKFNVDDGPKVSDEIDINHKTSIEFGSLDGQYMDKAVESSEAASGCPFAGLKSFMEEGLP